MASNFFNNVFLFITTNRNWVLGTLISVAVAANILGLFGAGRLFAAIALGGTLVLGWFAFSATAARGKTPADEAQRGREFNSVINRVHDGIILYDRNFTVLEFNEAAEKIFGIPADKVLGKRLDPGLVKEPGLTALTQVIFPSLAPRVQQLSETGAWPQISSITLEKPTREFMVSLHPIADAAGETASFLKLIEDKTEQERTVAATNEFVSVAAHQLRTPLTAIKWSLESIAEAVKDGTKEVKNLITETRELAERALETANKLLDVTNLEEGKMEYHFSEVDVLALVQKILQTVAPIAKSHEVLVYLTPPPSALPKILADEVRVGNVIMNLLDNAIRYNVRGGKVTVSLEVVAPASPDSPRFGEADKLASRGGPASIKVSVEDTGIGIPENEKGKIFSKLQRASNAIQMEPNGNGLGLYIAKEVIAAHGGTVGVSSVQNRGTTVWFTLPTAGNRSENRG